MSSTHYAVTPNKWCIINVTNNEGETFSKVFGTWSGGYLDGDSWRLNSGIKKIEEDDDNYTFTSKSGARYICAKSSYGVAGASNYGILHSFKGKHPDRVDILDEFDVSKILYTE